tara:strand:+ start:20 stop:661 length:642 start_codon:yes stop_codon:yes gene_type:complete
MISFINSSIGKKVIIAISGLLLSFFLVVHLVGNLTLFGGEDLFNSYVQSLKNIKLLVRIAEIGLSIIFLLHIYNTALITYRNNRANQNKYAIDSSNTNSSFFSRNMSLSGTIVLMFLILHLQTFWLRFQNDDNKSYYDVIIGNEVGFGRPEICIFYIIGIILLGFHLKHGFQSAIKSLGLPINNNLVNFLGMIFWLLIPVGFISIPIYFGFIK